MFKRGNELSTVLDEDSDSDRSTSHVLGATIVLPVSLGRASVASGSRFASTRRYAWMERYRTGVVCSDLLAFGISHAAVTIAPRASGDVGSWRHLGVTAAALFAVLVALGCSKAWDERILGIGREECRRVTRAYVLTIAMLAIAGYGWGATPGGPWTFGPLVLALALTLSARMALMWSLSCVRARGRSLRSMLVVGEIADVHELVAQEDRLRAAGRRVDGICLVSEAGAESLPVAIDDVPVLGLERDVIRMAEQHRFEAIAFLPSDRRIYARAPEMCRDLERLGVDILVAPVFMDAAWSRSDLVPVARLPLLQLQAPCYRGPLRILKSLRGGKAYRAPRWNPSPRGLHLS
ncbi:hypothetical protein NWP13_23545 [Rhodococcus pyridinivorans]|nr:hypothetical protein [Rhodococcus pyridinivorans]